MYDIMCEFYVIYASFNPRSLSSAFYENYLYLNNIILNNRNQNCKYSILQEGDRKLMKL